jgi:hypothetical protein
MTERQKVITQIALSYLIANLDYVNETFASDTAGSIRRNGDDEQPVITEDEAEELLFTFQ